MLALNGAADDAVKSVVNAADRFFLSRPLLVSGGELVGCFEFLKLHLFEQGLKLLFGYDVCFHVVRE